MADDAPELGLTREELEADFKGFLSRLKGDQPQMASQAMNAVDRRYPNHDLQAMMSLMALAMNRHTRFVMDVIDRNNRRVAEQLAAAGIRPEDLAPEAQAAE